MKESVTGEMRKYDSKRMMDGYRTFLEEFYYLFSDISRTSKDVNDFQTRINFAFKNFQNGFGNEFGSWKLEVKLDYLTPQIVTQNIQ